MKTIIEAYLEMYEDAIITEAIHPQIQEVMNSDIPLQHKLNSVTKTVRHLIASGEDTGLESDKPKKGSSRAVFFPKDPHEYTLDGKKTQSPVAVKIAFKGSLDPYHGEHSLLGEDQNSIESDHVLNRSHSVLQETDHNTYATNHEGVIAPVFDSHPENHHLTMGRVEKFNAKDLADHTKNAQFPKGLKLDELTTALTYEHEVAHGKKWKPSEQLKKIVAHPYTESMIDMMRNTDMHPNDVSPRNMGIWVHPHTGHRYPVMIDWGFSNNIAAKYTKARRKKYARRPGFDN